MTDSPTPDPVQPDWQPDNDVERALADALAASDSQAYFRVLSLAELYLPRFVADPADEPRLLTVDLFGQTFLPVFTSAVALANQFGSIVDGYAITNYAELRRKWPSPQWRLTINPGTPIDAYVSIETVELAATGDIDIPTVVDAIAVDLARDQSEPGGPPRDAATLLHAAAERSDVEEYVRVLVDSVLTVPTGHEVTDAAELFEPTFPWIRKGFPPVIDVFTSPEAHQRLAGGTGPTLAVAAGLLLTVWPQGCSLSLDPGAAHGLVLTEEQVRGLALWPDTQEEITEMASR